MASGSKVTLRGRFPVGERVTLFNRAGATEFVKGQAGSPLARAAVDENGAVIFRDVPPGAYWVAAEGENGWRGVAVTVRPHAREPRRRPEKAVEKLSPQEVRDRLAATRPPQDPSAVVTGPRSTATVRAVTNGGEPFANAATGVPSENPEVAPFGRIEDVPEGTQLESHTVTGEARVVVPEGSEEPDEAPAKPAAKKKAAPKKPSAAKKVAKRLTRKKS